MSEQQSEQLEKEPLEKVVLDAEEAFDLLFHGIDAWNKWVEANPRADVFVGGLAIDRGRLRFDGRRHRLSWNFISNDILCFKRLKFPSGTLKIVSANQSFGLDFTGADLSQTTLDLSGFKTKRSVNLTDCQLADGGHNFENMDIQGQFNCSNVEFGDESISFHQSVFQGGLNLENAKFGDGDKDFSGTAIHREFNTLNTNFGNGFINFAKARVSHSSLNLSHSILGSAYLNLNSAQCVNGVDISGKVLANGSSFKQLTVSGGSFNAQSTQFADGLLSFEGAQFSGSEANFSHAKFGEGTVSFEHVTFGRGASFENTIFQQGNKSFLNSSVAGGEFKLSSTIFSDGDISFTNTTFKSALLDLSQSRIGKANLDFCDAKFHQGLNIEKLTIDGRVSCIDMQVLGGQFNAREVKFTDGNICFKGARFVETFADFSSAVFGEGDISFENVTFEQGASFENTTFSQGDKLFAGLTVTAGEFNAVNASFNKGVVSFKQANFTSALVNFNDATFGEGKLDFEHAVFGAGACFIATRFGQGKKIFMDIQVTDGDFVMSDANFGEGNVLFTRAKFLGGSVRFNSTQFGAGQFVFERVELAQGAEFIGCKFSSDRKSFMNMKIVAKGFCAAGAQFNDGDVSFKNAVFGDEKAYFTEAVFGKGYVDFHHARFAQGSCFKQAVFGEGDVSFDHAAFGSGASFEKATFGQGDKSFIGLTVKEDVFNAAGASFNKGNVNFNDAKFEGGNVTFAQARFGEGNIRFEQVNFVNGASFEDVIFGAGCKSFVGACVEQGDFNAARIKFNSGDVNFTELKVVKGLTDFSHGKFGKGEVRFNQAEFGKGVSFKEAVFEQGDKLFVGIKVVNGQFNAIKAQFSNGNVDFYEANFEQSVVFDNAVFGEGKFRISDCKFSNIYFKNVDFSRSDVDIEDCQITGEYLMFDEAKIKWLNMANIEFDIQHLSFVQATLESGVIDLLHEQTCIEFINFSFANLNKTEINAIGWLRDNLEMRFDQVELESCKLNFENNRLKGGLINFDSAICQGTSINFKNSKLEYDSIIFADVSLVNCEISFQGSNIQLAKDAKLDAFNVKNAQFNNCQVNLSYATFDCNIAFNEIAVTDQSKIDFTSAIFEKEVSFKQATISASKMNFYKTRFEKAYVDFQEINTPNASLNFEYTHFGGNVSFAKATDTSSMRLLSFKFASFEGSFDLTDLQFGCVVDLTHTKFTNQVALDGVRCALPRKKDGYKQVAQDKQDTGRLRRLKEIAENNKDHQQALHFHADEMRAKRWNEHSSWQSVLDLSFDAVSEYGQSILRPFIGWFTMFVLLVGVFSIGAPAMKVDDGRSILDKIPMGHAANVVLSNSMPFLTTSKASKEKSMQVLFGYKPAGWVYIVLSIHTALSLVFLFLMGLGFRNRFRI